MVDERSNKYQGAPIDVNIRCFETSSIGRKLEEGHELLGWAIRFGAVVCERDHYWNELRAKWIDRLPFPLVSTAEERAMRAFELYGRLRDVGDEDAATEQLTTYLTQVARSRLIRSGIYPVSRPELPDELRQIGECELADRLDEVLRLRWT